VTLELVKRVLARTFASAPDERDIIWDIGPATARSRVRVVMTTRGSLLDPHFRSFAFVATLLLGTLSVPILARAFLFGMQVPS
jgi:hypothetical protein